MNLRPPTADEIAAAKKRVADEETAREAALVKPKSADPEPVFAKRKAKRESKSGPFSPNERRVLRTKTLFTGTDLARLCEVDLKTIHNWTSRGKVAHFESPGGHLRFTREHILKFLRAYHYPVPGELLDAPVLRKTAFLVLDDAEAMTRGGPAAPMTVRSSGGETLYEQNEKGELIRALGSDGGAPEDQSFARDWAWVVDALNAERER